MVAERAPRPSTPGAPGATVRSYADGVLERKRQTRFGRDMYPLALGRHLRGSACTRTRQTADGCTLPAAGDGSDDGAQSRGAANHLLTSARARLAGLRDGLGS